MRSSEHERSAASAGVAMQSFQNISGGNISQLPTELLQLALTSADTILYQWDAKSGKISFSDNMGQVFPYNCPIPTSEVDWLDCVHEEDRELLQSEVSKWLAEPDFTSNCRYRLKLDNKTVWVRQSGVAPSEGDNIVGIIYFNCTPPSRDLRGIRVSSVELSKNEDENTAFTYPETLIEQLHQSIRHADENGREGALLILSIQNFGMIINAYGHQPSESISQEIADEIRRVIGDNNSLHRIQRDQFAIILNDCPQKEIGDRCKAICKQIDNYGCKSSFGDLHTICAFGTHPFPDEDRELSATHVIDAAFLSLHKSGALLPVQNHDTAAEQNTARKQMGLANYLRKSIQENKLRMAFQPVVTSTGGEIAYYEALLRIIGEDGRISSAGPLIPVAEQMGLVDMVDHLVLDMVFQELDQASDVRLAMNVSNLTTENPNWLRHFQSLLRNRPDIASRLIVEITETAAHRDMRRTAYFVASMQEMGCTVALDDFGSGFTSFRQLKALSVDMVKIDGSFVKDMVQKSDNMFFVKTLLEFTRCFGLESVAEFVENGETAKALMDLGVDYQQGYYFGKPENFRGWLTPHQQ